MQWQKYQPRPIADIGGDRERHFISNFLLGNILPKPAQIGEFAHCMRNQ